MAILSSEVELSRTGKVLVGLTIWLLVAAAAVGAGLLRWAPAPFPQFVLLALGAGLLGFTLSGSRAHEWPKVLTVRRLAVLHLVRFVGFYFLELYQRGELPFAFAVLGGWGDIVVASLVIPLLFLPVETPKAAAVWLAWNTLGLADILFVVATAGRLAYVDPESMAALMRLPLGLLPTFVVPLVIASHVLIYVHPQLRRHWRNTALA